MAKSFVVCLFLLAATGIASAADVNCCKVCCKGSQCVMNHRAAHDCSARPPCH
jgi:hypothetical protein